MKRLACIVAAAVALIVTNPLAAAAVNGLRRVNGL